MTLFDYLDKHPVWTLVWLGIVIPGAVAIVEAFGKWRRK